MTDEEQAPIRLMLADDHALLRDGIRSLIDGQSGISVIAEAGDVGELLPRLEAARPDGLLLDL